MKNVLNKLTKNEENVKAIDLEIKKKIEQIKKIENDIEMNDTVLESLKNIYKEPRIVEGRKNNIDNPIDCQAEIVNVLMNASIPPDHQPIISYLMTFKCYNKPVFKYLLHYYKYNRRDTPLEETVPGSIFQEALMGYTFNKDSLECMGPEEIPEKTTVDLKGAYKIVTGWLDKEEDSATPEPGATPEQNEARAIFVKLDKDGVGTLSSSVLSSGLTDFGLGDADISELLTKLDLKDDKINMEEWIAGYERYQELASAADGSSPPKEKGAEGAEAAGVAAKKEGEEHVAAGEDKPGAAS